MFKVFEKAGLRFFCVGLLSGIALLTFKTASLKSHQLTFN